MTPTVMTVRGPVAAEYFMTKGHFHSVLETAEIYYCLKGRGYMVMETPEGELTLKMVEVLVEGGVKAIEITYTCGEAVPRLSGRAELPEEHPWSLSGD